MRKKCSHCNGKWLPLCVCVRERERERKRKRQRERESRKGITVGRKELKLRRKYEKGISSWPPFVRVDTKLDHVGDWMERWDLGSNKTWFGLNLPYFLAV